MYKDTSYILAGNQDKNKVDLDDFLMTDTDSLSANDGCPTHVLSVKDSGGYPIDKLAIDADNDLLVTVDHTLNTGQYTITIVAKVPWDGDDEYWISQDFQVTITIDQHLKWDTSTAWV